MTDIPEETKRIVRQQAGFGCCKCGLPIIEYHHIIKETTKAEEIMLLCPLCHHEATVKAMPLEEQFAYKKSPVNIKEGFVQGRLKINQTAPAITLGGNQFIGTGAILLVDGESLLEVDQAENRLELSLKLYDNDDNLIANIVRNEWMSGDPLPWDIESSFQWLKIRQKSKDVSLAIDARRYPLEIKASLWRKGQNFLLKPNELIFNGVVTNTGLKQLGLVALSLDANTVNKTFSIVPNPRYGKGSLVSNANISERVKQGLISWSDISCVHEYSIILERKKYTVKKCRKCDKIQKDWLIGK